MRVEILYVPGCPNYQPTIERLQAVLASEAVKAGIQGIPVTTEVEAKALLFPGSPPFASTVRTSNHIVRAHPAWRVACMKIGVAFRQRSCCG